MKRGDIWWAGLPSPAGSDPGYRRPVVIVQSNAFKASDISTVIVVAITSKLALSQAPGNVRLSKQDSGLNRPSVANVSQVISVDKRILSKKVGTLPSCKMEQLDQGLKLALGLKS